MVISSEWLKWNRVSMVEWIPHVEKVYFGIFENEINLTAIIFNIETTENIFEN